MSELQACFEGLGQCSTIGMCIRDGCRRSTEARQFAALVQAQQPQRTAKVVQLATKADDIADALETLDILREAVMSGQVIAFCGVAIEPDDCTTRWQFSTRPVTKLRMLGAVSSLAHHLHDD